MSEPRLCCNCLHCARWKKKDGIECHCDLNDKYLGYLQVMDEENDCKHWEKETKWDLQREHDKQIRADAERDFQNSDYWNDYLAKVIADAKADALGEYATMLMNVFSHSCEFYFISDDWTIEAIEKDKIDGVILKCLEKVKGQEND